MIGCRRLRALENTASSHLVRIVLLLAFAAISVARADLPIPTTAGTTWRYAHAEQTSESKQASDEPLVVRIAGPEEFGGQQLLKFETLNGETLVKTELL